MRRAGKHIFPLETPARAYGRLKQTAKTAGGTSDPSGMQRLSGHDEGKPNIYDP
jgi:hypothetical protein